MLANLYWVMSINEALFIGIMESKEYMQYGILHMDLGDLRSAWLERTNCCYFKRIGKDGLIHQFFSTQILVHQYLSIRLIVWNQRKYKDMWATHKIFHNFSTQFLLYHYPFLRHANSYSSISSIIKWVIVIEKSMELK